MCSDRPLQRLYQSFESALDIMRTFTEMNIKRKRGKQRRRTGRFKADERPLRRRTMSLPLSSACPEVGAMSVESMLMVVVFPAPLGPRKPNISPLFTSKEMLSTAVTVLNRLVRFSVRTATIVIVTFVLQMKFFPRRRLRCDLKRAGTGKQDACRKKILHAATKYHPIFRSWT